MPKFPDPVIEVASAEFERLLLMLDAEPEPVPELAAAAARLAARTCGSSSCRPGLAE